MSRGTFICHRGGIYMYKGEIKEAYLYVKREIHVKLEKFMSNSCIKRKCHSNINIFKKYTGPGKFLFQQRIRKRFKTFLFDFQNVSPKVPKSHSTVN